MEKNRRPFANAKCWIKQSNLPLYVFFCIGLEISVCIDGYSLTMIDFVDWLGSKWGDEGCFLFFLFLFACLLAPLL